jgi:phosphoglycolate phosphatase-like HAD superfamily hydrolase
MKKIILWDNDGTVTGSKNPNDTTNNAKVILPNVETTMRNAEFNFIISGCKSAESEAQDFDPEKISSKFIDLMKKLPISAAAFSPLKGGVACYVVLKKDNGINIIKAHEDQRYKEYIGKFKKPDIGMFVVIKDLAEKEFNLVISYETTAMIGDTWQDKEAAKSFNVPFLGANEIHEL